MSGSASPGLGCRFCAPALHGRGRRAMPVLIVLLSALVWSLAGPIHPAPAADVLWRLTHGDQDALVIGTLASAAEGEFTLAGVRSLAGLPVAGEIRVTRAGPALTWSPGSSIIASVDQSGPGYTVRWGVFLASSHDATTLTILDGTLTGGERAAFQRYINSEGRDSEFAFIEDRVYVKSADGSLELIYSSPGMPSTTATTDEPAQPAGWNVGYLAGAAGVLILVLVLFRLRPRPPRPPASTTRFPDTTAGEDEETSEHRGTTPD